LMERIWADGIFELFDLIEADQRRRAALKQVRFEAAERRSRERQAARRLKQAERECALCERGWCGWPASWLA
jgi:hypothetical protein